VKNNQFLKLTFFSKQFYLATCRFCQAISEQPRAQHVPPLKHVRLLPRDLEQRQGEAVQVRSSSHSDVSRFPR
jgi:hypothetical protein